MSSSAVGILAWGEGGKHRIGPLPAFLAKQLDISSK